MAPSEVKQNVSKTKIRNEHNFLQETLGNEVEMSIAFIND